MKLVKLISVTFLFLSAFSNLSLAQTDDLNTADRLTKQGNFQAAISFMDEYIESNPKDPQGYLKRAMIYGALGQLSDKKRDLQYANYLNPYAYLYVKEASRTNITEKKKYVYDSNDSDGNFMKSPVNNDYYSMYLKDQLDLHSQDTLIEKAIFYLSKMDLPNTKLTLSKINPTDNILGIYYDIKGLVELKSGNLEAAIDYFSKAIDNSKAFPLAYHNRAIVHKLNGDYEKAKLDLMTAIGLNEDISVFFFTLAKLSERLDNPNEAISFYKEAINKNQDYIEARTNYSILQKTLGNYGEAISELSEVTKMMDEDYKSHFINGGIHLTYGDYEQAIEEFNLFLEERVDDCDALFNRGMAKILSGNKVEGCEDIYLSIEQKGNSKRMKILSSFCPSY